MPDKGALGLARIQNSTELDKPAAIFLVKRDKKGKLTASLSVSSDRSISRLRSRGRFTEVFGGNEYSGQVVLGQYGSHVGLPGTREGYVALDGNGKRALRIRDIKNTLPLVPSPSGDYAVGWAGTGTPGGPPIFYDVKGIRNKWARNYSGEGWPEAHETLGVRFAPDGLHVAVVARDWDRRYWVHFFDARGNLLWSSQAEGELPQLRFSPSGRLLSAATASRLAVYEKSGAKVLDVPAEGKFSKFAAFSSDERRIAVAASLGRVHVVGLPLGQVEWAVELTLMQGENILPEGTLSVEGMAASDDLKTIAVAGKVWKLVPWTSPHGRQIDAPQTQCEFVAILVEGKIADLLQFPEGTLTRAADLIGPPSMQVFLAGDGKELLVTSVDSVTRYALP